MMFELCFLIDNALADLDLKLEYQSNPFYLESNNKQAACQGILMFYNLLVYLPRVYSEKN